MCFCYFEEILHRCLSQIVSYTFNVELTLLNELDHVRFVLKGAVQQQLTATTTKLSHSQSACVNTYIVRIYNILCTQCSITVYALLYLIYLIVSYFKIRLKAEPQQPYQRQALNESCMIRSIKRFGKKVFCVYCNPRVDSVLTYTYTGCAITTYLPPYHYSF